MKEFDTSALENTGWRAFIKWFKEWYSFEFTELPKEFKDDAIDLVLNNTHSIFTRKDVLAENLCTKCGICCEEIHCVYYNQETHLCTRHDNQESEICKIYPWDDDVGFILTLNCGYQKQFFLNYFDKLFTKAIQMRWSDGEKEENKSDFKGVD